MRRIYLPILFLGLLISCNADQDFIDTVQAYNEDTSPQGEDENAGDPEDPDDPEIPDVDLPPTVDFEGQLEINTTPCEFTLDVIEANGTLSVDCTIDLNDQTIELPANVALEYSGGQIINGTLNFSGGTIDGKLMNKDLTLTGDVALNSDVFQFHPERWDVVQGETSSEVAQNNNDVLEGLMFYTKELGASTFVIDQFDAYFEVSKVTSTTTNQNFYPTLEAINVPSDYTLQMSENTILRVFPNNYPAGSATLLAVDRASNIIIRGGTLFGDRDLRTYPSTNAEQGSHLFGIRSGVNIVLDGITMKMGSLGGLNINSWGFTFDPDYDPTHDIIVMNCLFDRNRMMSIALTDGYNILIDNNTFLENGQPTANSDGGVVGFAINIEPVRTRDSSTGELVLYQEVKDVVIRNNEESGSRGAFNIYAGDNIIIEENTIESSVNWSYASNCQVRNNNFIATDISQRAVIAEGNGETVFNNSISGNTFTGYGTAIAAYWGKMSIAGNNIQNCLNGISLYDIVDTDVSNNQIMSSVANSRGITFQTTEANNINITSNIINVQNSHLRFIGLNQEAGQSNNLVSVFENDFGPDGVLQFSSTSGVNLSDNTSNGRVQMGNTSHIEIRSNVIDSPDGHGISLINNNSNIVIAENTISVPTNFNCINIQSPTSPNDIDQDGNTCN